MADKISRKTSHVPAECIKIELVCYKGCIAEGDIGFHSGWIQADPGSFFWVLLRYACRYGLGEMMKQEPQLLRKWPSDS